MQQQLTREDVIRIVYEILNSSTQRIKIASNQIQSASFKSGSSGWMLSSDGSAELQNANIRGAVDATSGSITGPMTVTGTLTLGDSSGLQVKLRGDLGEVDFLYNSSNVGKLLGIASGDMAITADKDLYLTANNTTQVMRLVANGDVNLRTAGTKIYWPSGRALTDKSSYIECNGDFAATNGMGIGSGKAYSVGGSQGTTSLNFDIVTRVSSTHYYTHSFDFRGGIITHIGGEESHDI
jgi:hypothetical protein